HRAKTRSPDADPTSPPASDRARDRARRWRRAPRTPARRQFFVRNRSWCSYPTPEPMRMTVAVMATGTIAIALALFAPQRRSGSARVDGYRVVHTYPHDRDAFTQGLIVRDGYFYEGTGLVGRSGLRKVKIDTGEVVQFKALEPPYFGEGITEWKGTLVQLTWQTEIGFVYDLTSFERRRTFSYKGEGWGLTHDGTRLIMSDGSSSLRFLDPETFKETGRVTVRDRGAAVTELNELEYVRGEVYANIWQTDRIAR